MTADRFEVDTDQLRSAAARLAEIGDRLGHPVGPGLSPAGDAAAGGAAHPVPGAGTAPTGDPAEPPGPMPDPAELLGDAGLDGWSFGSVLSRLHASWDACVAGLAADYSDHADQLRAAADRYDDAERIIDQVLRGGSS
ncbi:hypothetical protein Athai_52900 [Actinocatenispora thailandica]|uniref:Uncharacterized protein n=1 Tax=Actinocatenispora thailandica TaxID=227318 RepID=A0A7R7DUQ6_9ACTN|nr:hypothetical protein [Actinocatenispora thailandica]BCJ37787.1 hypothetical protein Athai_52900 [Actinocatenispora thailandica]